MCLCGIYIPIIIGTQFLLIARDDCALQANNKFTLIWLGRYHKFQQASILCDGPCWPRAWPVLADITHCKPFPPQTFVCRVQTLYLIFVFRREMNFCVILNVMNLDHQQKQLWVTQKGYTLIECPALFFCFFLLSFINSSGATLNIIKTIFKITKKINLYSFTYKLYLTSLCVCEIFEY